MSKLQQLLATLRAGHAVKVICGGGSMRGRIELGQVVTITPVDAREVAIGDIVFVKWIKGNYMMHLVKDIRDEQFLIGNNLGKVNGWVGAGDILGKITKIEDTTD